jgi:hypothetical protein
MPDYQRPANIKEQNSNINPLDCFGKISPRVLCFSSRDLSAGLNKHFEEHRRSFVTYSNNFCANERERGLGHDGPPSCVYNGMRCRVLRPMTLSHSPKKCPLLPAIPLNATNGPGSFQYLKPILSWSGPPPKSKTMPRIMRPGRETWKSGDIGNSSQYKNQPAMVITLMDLDKRRQ